MTDTPTRADLLPCPFCGGEAKHYHHTPTGIMNTDHIECDNCSNGTCLHETKAEAVTAWNTRAPTADAERIAALEGEVERLRKALGDIARDSNPDWTEKRVYPNDVLDDIHKAAAGAYYGETL